ncbi:MAG: gephyrin-like molybdotransferase Glp [Candidatus Limivicinus sp.]|jgi:molybdopterin molybdotransferase
MLQVKTPEEVLELIEKEFSPIEGRTETVSLAEAAGRVLAEDILAKEYVPDFSRSTVDGYALRAEDSFGCSDAVPAILPVSSEILMGEGADFTLPPGSCCTVPTGGAIPDGADCAVMLEYTEDYGDGTVGISRAGSPGLNIIFRGDDVYPGKPVIKKGRVLRSQDVGALAAIGVTEVPVVKKLLAGIISTGDELVPPEEKPGPGQVRDVNAPMLAAMLREFGVSVSEYGIMRDDEAALSGLVRKAAEECDAVIISGGSSVGVKDAACRIIESMGELLFHGIAVKPGKPTIMGKIGNKPLIGLPGHPAAAYFVARAFVLPLFARLMGMERRVYTTTARLSESVSANHGRAQLAAVHLEERDGQLWAEPVRSKSGLITALAGADGYFCIARDCEGLPRGAEIQVFTAAGG